MRGLLRSLTMPFRAIRYIVHVYTTERRFRQEEQRRMQRGMPK